MIDFYEKYTNFSCGKVFWFKTARVGDNLEPKFISRIAEENTKRSLKVLACKDLHTPKKQFSSKDKKVTYDPFFELQHDQV